MTYYHVGAAGDKLPQSVMRVVVVTHQKNGNVSSDGDGDVLIFPTALGVNPYLNMIEVHDRRQMELLEKKGWIQRLQVSSS